MIIACYAFSILLVLEALKKLIFCLMEPENNYEILKDPMLCWTIDGLCILASQISGIYIASVLLKEAFLPLLFCSMIGSMGVIQTAMIGVFFYLEFIEYKKNRPLNDNNTIVMNI